MELLLFQKDQCKLKKTTLAQMVFTAVVKMGNNMCLWLLQ